MKLQSIDGCTAATYIAYAFSEVATIYPITPIAEMGEVADKWIMAGLKNLLGNSLQVKEMESELGAAGATHGALAGGALSTTFTSSQGLMLMIPNMYKIAGELLPAVFHVGCRSLATHALSIFGDHQDVMACRATGFTMLASASVQETHDLAIAAHIAAIKGSLPVLHFFDGWRTSNETATIQTLAYDELQPLLPEKEIGVFRAKAMNPEHPELRGSAQNSDVYFQNTEARNRFYDAFPKVMQNALDDVAKLTGRQYHLFDYIGSKTAESIIISIGSSCEVVEQTVEFLNSNGGNYGAVKVRLYRPFSVEALLNVIPQSVKRIAVLDRTKEAGSLGEPLFIDVSAAVQSSGRDIHVIGGRYGLSSKEFDPTMVKAVFDNLDSNNPINGFTVGINDDLTHLSLPLRQQLYISDSDSHSAIFYGMGSDGTVGATRVAAHILGESANLYSQAYFEYSAKKSGGYTVCQLRYSSNPIKEAYSIEQADYVGCNKSTYVDRFKLIDNLRDNGIFILNSPWSEEDMSQRLPAALRRQIAKKKIRFYNIDALKIASDCNLGVRINMIMLACFFKLNETVGYEEAKTLLSNYIKELYSHEGGEVVTDNLKAIEVVENSLVAINYPASWLTAQDETAETGEDIPSFIKDIAKPCMEREGNSLPVSAFSPDGRMPMGTTAYEKRTIADFIPHWDVDKCIECTECSLVCPHAAIRPFLLNPNEKKDAPSEMTTKDAHAKPLAGLQYRIQVYPQDCTGCGSCAVICPGKALSMTPISNDIDQQKRFLGYIQKNVSPKPGLVKRTMINGSQFYTPLLQFSGACAGCGETPYVKLITQLMGERMIIANATGCSSIWGANFPSNAYCVNSDGHGPAWGNSLFEDNAEYGYGIAVAIAHRREALVALALQTVDDTTTPQELKDILTQWISSKDDAEQSAANAPAVISALKKYPDAPNCSQLLSQSDLLIKKSIWAIGGDGWAYDIGFAGLDHVLAQNIDINILVMDTECYSNTGGQTSKATPLGAMTKYSYNGKRTYKKDLARMMATYPDVYVASISLGANYMHTINALTEADNHRGPSIVVAYCPCINHGIRTGMSHSIVEEKNAVVTGYWQLFRYDPAKSPRFEVDSAAPNGDMSDFLDNEDRYADLKMKYPADSATLQKELEQHCEAVYSLLEYNAKYISDTNKTNT